MVSNHELNMPAELMIGCGFCGSRVAFRSNAMDNNDLHRRWHKMKKKTFLVFFFFFSFQLISMPIYFPGYAHIIGNLGEVRKLRIYIQSNKKNSNKLRTDLTSLVCTSQVFRLIISGTLIECQKFSCSLRVTSDSVVWMIDKHEKPEARTKNNCN